MKKIIGFILVAGIALWALKRYGRQPNALTRHLDEMTNLQNLAKVTGNAAIASKPPTQTYGDLPLSGRIITPFSPDSPGPVQAYPTQPDSSIEWAPMPPWWN